MDQGIWIFAEHDGRGLRSITLELLSEARKLAQRLDEELCVCLLGVDVARHVPALAQYGAKKIFLVEHAALAQYSLASCTAIVASLIGRWRPSVLMLGDTPIGAEVAPRLAARLRVPCITGVKKITGGKNRLQLTKSVYNDLAYATVDAAAGRPLILTIPAGETDIVPAAETVEPEIVRCDAVLPVEPPRTVTRRLIPGDPRTVAIHEADRIVAVGRGAGVAGVGLLQELADLIGAAIGGSRAAADAGLIPRERQIGISGTTVRPKLLIACGISGARQFTIGMENSELVVAVNEDATAGIFEFANLRIKGDLLEVIPAVIRRLRG